MRVGSLFIFVACAGPCVILVSSPAHADAAPDRGVVIGVGVGAENSSFAEAPSYLDDGFLALPVLTFLAGYRVNAMWAIELVRLQEFLKLGPGMWRHEVTAVQGEYTPRPRLRTALGVGLARYTVGDNEGGSEDHVARGFEAHGSMGGYLARGSLGGVRLGVTLLYADYDEGRALVALLAVEGLVKFAF